MNVPTIGAAPEIMSVERWGISPVQLMSSPVRMAFSALQTIPDNQGRDYLPGLLFSVTR
jgi:hypothetical protein